MNNLIEHVKTLLSPPVANTGNTDNDNITNKGVISAFVIANITRKTVWKYATISSQGNVAFHAMAPFNFVDDLETNMQYAKKTVYVSVNQDPQANQDSEGQVRYYNQNIGNFSLLLRPSIEFNGKTYPNAYNKIELHSPVIKQALIPADIDKFNSALLNEPCNILLQEVHANNANQNLDKKERAQLNIIAYQTYANSILDLFEQGLLEFSNILINPKPNTVSFGMGLEDSMKSMSNPWLNKAVLAGLSNTPFTKSPVLNQYTTVVQIVESEDMELLYSDNNNMLGKRVIYQDEQSGKKREALGLIGIIKDYNSDTTILVNITDPNNTLNTDSRGRVEAFEGLLAKNINTFEVQGTLRPIVRTIGSSASRNGNIFWELVVNKYNVYQSTNLRSSLEADAFESLSFEHFAEENDEVPEGIGSFVLGNSSVSTSTSSSTNSNASSNTDLEDNSSVM